MELLKKDKAKLVAQVSAQESVIDGLRSERKLWGQELAQQGMSQLQIILICSVKKKLLTSIVVVCDGEV